MIDTTRNPSSNRHDPAITHESRIFFLDADDKVLPIDHDRYVAWARREVASAEFAGQRLTWSSTVLPARMIESEGTPGRQTLAASRKSSFLPSSRGNRASNRCRVSIAMCTETVVCRNSC